MKKYIKILIVLLLAIAIFVSGCTQYGGDKQPESSLPPLPDIEGNVVKITSSGFSPETLTIKKGETVIFYNIDTSPHRPASAVHPTHNVYPEPGGCIGSKFDACKSLGRGDTFEFTFNHVGEWKYHDHLRPSTTGLIKVIE